MDGWNDNVLLRYCRSCFLMTVRIFTYNVDVISLIRSSLMNFPVSPRTLLMCRILDYIIICISTSTEPPISVPTWALRYSLRVGISTYLIFNQFSWYIAFSSR